MPSHCQKPSSKIHSLLDRYYKAIGMKYGHNIAYYQIDSLSLVESQTCKVIHCATAGEISHQLFRTEHLVKTYYQNGFPDLKPVTCTVSSKHSLKDSILNALEVCLTTNIRASNNTMIIPCFAPLNQIGIFVIDLKGMSDQIQTECIPHTILGNILAYAQNCHMKICQFQQQASAQKIKLTDREREILLWVVRGKSNTVIANIIGISSHTVNGYLRNIYLKTDTCDRTSAAVKAIHHGLLHKTMESAFKKTAKALIPEARVA